LLILTFKYRALKNYVAKHLDYITRIEILLFFGFLVFYVIKLVNDRFTSTINNNGVDKAWFLFIDIQKIFFILLLLGSFTYAKRYIKNIKNEILLSQPVSFKIFTYSRIIEMLTPFILLSPVWVILFVLFTLHIKLSLAGFLLLTWLQIGAYFFPIFVGMNLLISFLGKRKNLPRIGISIVLLFIFVFFISVLDKIKFPVFQFYSGFLLILLSVFSLLQVFLILNDIAAYYPENLIPVSGKFRFGLSKKITNIYSIITPLSIKAIVHKDFIYILRNYRIFILFFSLFFILILTGILKSSNVKEGIQWFLSINIAAAYFLANVSFKFNENNVDNLFEIKSLPISAQRYWLAKFWNGFLPVIWLIILGLMIIILKFGFNYQIILPSTLAILFIAFTLIFIQTNFALYSYPFTRYAIVWYNLYIVIALTFFTIFLFPPLTVGFLIFGYAAIFRVFKRFNSVEILND